LKYFYKIIFFYLFILNLSIIANASNLSNKYYFAKKKYTNAILSNNKQKEIKYLQQLISYGKRLRKDVKLYRKALGKFKNYSQIKSNKKYYNISSINSKNNTIIINFKSIISKSYIKFDQYKKNGYFYYNFDLKGSFKNTSSKKINIREVKNILVYRAKNNTLRIRIKNKYNLKIIYIINKKTLIIKILNLKKKYFKRNKIKLILFPKKTNLFLNKTIVIDPGHGGKDSGAIGPHHRYEKDTVLNISKYLYKNLKQKGFKVYLTRNSDKYISLIKRTKFANKKHADIFISIHANSISRSKAKLTKGIETYFLSPARSERSKRIAAKENSGDINGLSFSSKNIVLTLLNRGKITASQKMAIDVQSYMLHNLKKYYGNNILDKGVREGPFWVLVGAQMPSILIEVGYISHPAESSNLYNKKYQKRLAKGISNGILSYFSKNN
jgi:N-acetylmuramoyl-L-alanine amidase